MLFNSINLWYVKFRTRKVGFIINFDFNNKVLILSYHLTSKYL